MKSYYINEYRQVVVITSLSMETYRMFKQMGYKIIFYV